MQIKQSCYSRWSWIVALILALVLLWMLLTDRGPSNTCCNTSTEMAATTELIPAEPALAVVEAFSFSASANDFISNGDGSGIVWLANTEALKRLLDGNLKAEGDDVRVVLSGTVDSDIVKQQKAADAQEFFGRNVTIDNQITIRVDGAAASLPPPAVKLYFGIGETSLPIDVETTLASSIGWLKANPDSRAVLSGFHDATGNQVANETLAKNRAEAVREVLKNAGIDETRIELRKPESIDGGADLAEARRVEIIIE